MNGYGHFLTGAAVVPGLLGAVPAGPAAAVGGAVGARRVGSGRRQRVALAKQRLRGRVGHRPRRSRSPAFVGGRRLLVLEHQCPQRPIVSPDEQLDLQARYEREYGKYRDLPQPQIFAVVDRTSTCARKPRRCACTGVYRVQNPHRSAITDIHVQMVDDKALASDRPGRRRD